MDVDLVDDDDDDDFLSDGMLTSLFEPASDSQPPIKPDLLAVAVTASSSTDMLQ